MTNDPEKNLGYLINKAAHSLKWSLNNRLSSYNLTASQWSVLRYLYSFEDDDVDPQLLSPASIADRLNANRPTITGLIDRLSSKGLVMRTTNPQDRRSQIISLTDKAKELIDELEELSEKTIVDGLNGFSNEDEFKLRDYLLRIINNLE